MTIREVLYKIENKERLTKTQRKRRLNFLIGLLKTLYNKEKYQDSDHYDLDYFGIIDLEHLFNTIDHDDYYKPILTKSAFLHNYEEYEIRGEKNKNLSLRHYLYTIRQELFELINEKKNSTQNEQKVPLTIAVKFKHTTDISKSRIFYVKSKNVEMRSRDNTDDIINKIFEVLLENYEREENILRNGSDYSFECVDLALVQFHDINMKRGSSYMESPKWISNKKATINPKNLKDNNCFQYAIVPAVHHQDINNNPERILKLKPYIINYNWKGINFPARRDKWKIFERNNTNIAINILSVSYNRETINLIRKSDYNHSREKQVILLMITDEEEDGYHNLTVKKISRLFRGITSNNNGDFYCLNCLHSFRTDNKLKEHERLCNNHDYCEPLMPKKDKNILKYNSGEKSLKVANVIYFDLEALQIKQHSLQNNPKTSYTEKKTIHEVCGYSSTLARSHAKSRHKSYRGKDCMDKFCKDLKTLAMKVTNYEKKEMRPLTQYEPKTF